MTNALITGCTGFIGSNLTVKLIEEDSNAYGLFRHASKGDLQLLGSIECTKGN